VVRARRAGFRALAAAAAACGLLVVPLSAQATLSATATQFPSLANETKVVFSNNGDETVTSFRHVIPPDWRISEAHLEDGTSCTIPEPREYVCGRISIPPGGTWTAYFTTPPLYATSVGFVTPYISLGGPSTFYLRNGDSEAGPFQAKWEGARPDFGDSRACTVPRVRGMTLRAAKRSIAAARCATGRVTRAWSRRPRGRVVAQSPPPRVVLDHQGLVNLVVSRGRRR
jgi:hypothetical protein